MTNLKTNDTKVRVIKASDERIVYDWGNGYRLKVDKNGYSLFFNDILLSENFRLGYRD